MAYYDAQRANIGYTPAFQRAVPAPKYFGITALIRLVIVEHDNPVNTLLHTCAILVLTISYAIIKFSSKQKEKL
ncbi:phosphate-starvation-inducible PsiE family protein [Priestia megaterium]|uniref:phosphate-starvation-inducible PsiE family protein n=1 Tax=Priestia megaterium TaxID=1404 RepID=UPI003D158FBD